MSMDEIIAAGPDLAEEAEWGGLPPPTIGYLLHGILPLGPVLRGSKHGAKSAEVARIPEAKRRMGMVKSSLFVLMLDLFDITNEAWEEVSQLGDDWEETVRGCMDSEHAEDLLGKMELLQNAFDHDSPSEDQDDESGGEAEDEDGEEEEEEEEAEEA